MNRYVLLFFLFFEAASGMGQKLYAVVNLTGEFPGNSYTDNHVKEEFRPSVPRIYGSWRIDVVYRKRRIAHKISLEESTLSKNFKIINKFKVPPYNELGFDFATYGTSINHLIVSYSLQKEDRKEKGFLFHSRIRFNYSAGMGFSFNRSKAYYSAASARSSGGYATPWTYHSFEALHYRDGFGVFLRGTGGFDLINKKGKRKLCFNVFYNQSLKDMVHFDIHYQYGYFNDPQRQVDVPKQVLRSRGTTFGFSIGVPITIKK